MVYKWLLRRGLRRIFYGIIAIILGFIFFVIPYPYPVLQTRFITIGRGDFITALFLKDIANLLMVFGTFVLLTGFVYLLVTALLEHMKKRRNASRSKTYQ